ncbi:SURF1 family protein [Bradyrhizobium prioriisuperbiae]|uniref:SURF1 family protein n=1 Tax=Bradyrhizobium prioriisuperbiae TaxID=2854389 RepID=UPI0028EAD510|nr:SURF1 family cytochrome oxidase biogenesis protein [Bradyrhizobium prioritasuperba]
MTAERMRSLLGMGVITLIMLATLVGLGVWQLQRRAEKHALIAALTERLATAPVALPAKNAWPALRPEQDEFRRVTFAAQVDAKPDARVFAAGSALRSDISGLGVWNFVPVKLASGETVVVNRGFVPDGKQASPALSAADPAQPVTLTGYLRFPEKPGAFSAHEDIAKRLWFVRDHLAMSRALHWGEVAPFYVDLEGPVPPSGLPKPGPLEVHLRDPHLQYAMTWFGLAIVVAAASGFWFASQRRA